MKKNKFLFLGMLALALTFTLVLAGCPGPDNPTFTSTTNSATANDAATLGFVGTGVSSGDPTVATAAIVGSKIAITSVAPGTATITVTYGPFVSTIAVTVADLGAVTPGTITKEVVTSLTVADSSPYTEITGTSTSGLDITSIETTGTAGTPGYKVFIKVSGAIPADAKGTASGSSKTGLNTSTWYGDSSLYTGTGNSPATEFAMIDIKGITDIAPTPTNSNTYKFNWVTMTYFPLGAWYHMEWPDWGKHIKGYGNGQNVEANPPSSGVVRYTGATSSYNDTSATDAKFTTNNSAASFEFLLWKNDPGRLITLQFDGNVSSYGSDGVPVNPTGKLAWIDYSAVTWTE
ncbi:MAG: hypothetical protein LBT11_06265 [Treponema sp.]|jgi:hypothetical protein|nr:hypothetical protein [Treponema sp.]